MTLEPVTPHLERLCRAIVEIADRHPRERVLMIMHGCAMDVVTREASALPRHAILHRKPRNGERLPDYHRLDLRVSRSWSLGLGRLEAHVDVLDLYDRENVRGFEEIGVVPDGSGGAALTRRPVTWTGFVPSVGLRWSF